MRVYAGDHHHDERSDHRARSHGDDDGRDRALPGRGRARWRESGPVERARDGARRLP